MVIDTLSMYILYIVTILLMMYLHFFRTCWTGNGALYDRKFARDFPAAPYIIDPSNPFNNVYISGIGKYIANSPEGTYYPGNGKWTNLVKHVDSLDLRKVDGTRY